MGKKKTKKKNLSLSVVVADLAASEHRDSLWDSKQLHQEGKGGELGGGSQFNGNLYRPERLFSKHLLTALQWATADR